MIADVILRLLLLVARIAPLIYHKIKALQRIEQQALCTTFKSNFGVCTSVAKTAFLFEQPKENSNCLALSNLSDSLTLIS